MPIKKDNTKKKKKKELTIEQILEYKEDNKDQDENDRKEMRLYRDILIYFISKDKEKSTYIDENTGLKFIETFKSTALCNWLLDKNIDLIHEFIDSRIAKTYRAHTIKARIINRIEKLMELGLINLDDEEVESERNKTMTHQYIVTRNGILIASLLNLQKNRDDSDEYKKNLQFVLNRFLDIIPYPYKNYENYYFHFLKEIFQNCLDGHQHVLFYFFNLLLQYRHNLVLNFSDVRSKVNELLYRKIITDKEFNHLFYKSLCEFNTPFWLRSLIDKDMDESLIYQEKNEALQLIRMQFKLDVENQIDRDISEVLKTNADVIKSFQFASKQKKHFTEKDVFENGLIEQIEQEHVLNYAVRTLWEKERNKNLLNSMFITTIIKCVHCGHILPYSFEIEKESFDEIFCIVCKEKGGIKPYDFMNETNYVFGYHSKSKNQNLS